MTRRGFLVAAAATAAGLFLGVSGCGIGKGKRRNLLLIVSDTLRADHLSSYGFPFETSPHVDSLARRGTAFTDLMSCAPITGASHASMMTGTYQTRHGVFGNGGTISENLTTIATICRDSEYETAAFVSNPALDPNWMVGIDRGFDVFDVDLPALERNRQTPYRDAAGTAEAAIGWLQGRNDGRFLLWVHFQEPHGPYEVPVATPAMGQLQNLERRTGEAHALPVLRGNSGPGGIPLYQVLGEERDPAVYRARYAARVAYVDEQIGHVLSAIGQQGLQDETLIAFTSDHGELLGEHDYYFQHGATAFQPGLHVPLIVAGPGVKPGQSISVPAAGVDVMPTLLDLVGLRDDACADQLQGRSLAHFARGTEEREATQTARFAASEGGIDWCVQVGRHKLSICQSDPKSSAKLFDLQSDPDENVDLAPREPALVAEMSALLDGFMGTPPQGSPPGPSAAPGISEENRRRLKSLGYLD